MPFRRLAALASTVPLALVAAVCFSACASTEPSDPPLAATDLRGDPDVVTAAAEVLEPRVRELANVQYIEASCIREETVGASGRKFVSDGPLAVRRDPAALHFVANGPKMRDVVETETTRLVLEPRRKHATRFTYDRNGRGIVGVAAVLLDLDVLGRAFSVESVGPVEGYPRLTSVAFVPAAGMDLPGVDRLELIFIEGRAVPRGIRVISADGSLLQVDITRATLDPPSRNPDAHFPLEIPAGFTVDEQRVGGSG